MFTYFLKYSLNLWNTSANVQLPVLGDAGEHYNHHHTACEVQPQSRQRHIQRTRHASRKTHEHKDVASPRTMFKFTTHVTRMHANTGGSRYLLTGWLKTASLIIIISHLDNTKERNNNKELKQVFQISLAGYSHIKI